jgi:cellulose synthase/poly-beta-1,6-N-acetylglucosamine synthase-like glycosyltransferase
MLLFYFFAAIVIWLGVLSVLSGLRFASYIRRETARQLSDFAPFVSVIAPCRGLEDGLPENIAAFFQQEYPSYEIIFVTDHAGDPSLQVVKEIIETQSATQRVSTRIVIAGNATDTGQKVHNLRAAVAEVDLRSEALVFVDTDARPHNRWLRSLVAPLAEDGIGAATGYRWFAPVKGGFASQLRSVWNASIASALGERRDKNFCWGGSTAILKATFEKLQVREHWRGTVSDDFTLTRKLQAAGLSIHFVPACLIPSFDSCTVKELLEFTNRQLKITRVYAPHLWKPVLVGSLLFCVVFFGGLALVLVRAFRGLSYAGPLIALVVIYALGSMKAFIRLRAVALVLSDCQKLLWRSLPAHLLLWPIASALYLWNAFVAAVSRRISWRGITYELKSANEAVIISREQ